MCRIIDKYKIYSKNQKYIMYIISISLSKFHHLKMKLEKKKFIVELDTLSKRLF